MGTLAISALLLGACAAEGSDGSRGTGGSDVTITVDLGGDSTTSPTRIADRPGPAIPADGEVHVLDVGAEPRPDLRHAQEPGTERFEVVSTNAITAESGGVKQSVTAPTTTQTIEVTVASRPDGRFDVRQEVLDVELGDDGSKAGRAGAEQAAEAVVGMTATGVIDPLGRSSDVAVELPDDAPPLFDTLTDQLESMMGQLSTPVPDQPIGVGGSWTTTQSIDLLGAEVLATTTFTLASADASGYTVRSVTSMAADGEQEISSGGQTGELLAFTSTGSGVAKVRRGHLVSESESRSRAEQTFEIDDVTLHQTISATGRTRPLG